MADRGEALAGGEKVFGQSFSLAVDLIGATTNDFDSAGNGVDVDYGRFVSQLGIRLAIGLLAQRRHLFGDTIANLGTGSLGRDHAAQRIVIGHTGLLTQSLQSVGRMVGGTSQCVARGASFCSPACHASRIVPGMLGMLSTAVEFQASVAE